MSLFSPVIACFCFALLAAPPLCAVPTQTSHPTSAQAPETPAAVITAPPAPIAPTPAEMRDMAASRLEDIGDQLRQAKDYHAAVACYRQAIRKYASAAYYNKIAISELLLLRPVEAEKAAQKAVRKDKYMAEAWNNLAVSYYMRNQFEFAIRGYRRAISLDPDYASFHNNLAAAYLDSQQFERGMEEYRKAFEIDPSFFEHRSQNGVSAHMNSPQERAQFSFIMARLFASKGDLDRALHFLRAALEDGYSKIDDVYRDQEFGSVRKDERFRALMKERPEAVR
jgi:tetratricopeptide (TPR) repeat protein